MNGQFWECLSLNFKVICQGHIIYTNILNFLTLKMLELIL